MDRIPQSVNMCTIQRSRDAIVMRRRHADTPL